MGCAWCARWGGINKTRLWLTHATRTLSGQGGFTRATRSQPPGPSSHHLGASSAEQVDEDLAHVLRPHREVVVEDHQQEVVPVDLPLLKRNRREVQRLAVLPRISTLPHSNAVCRGSPGAESRIR